MVEPVVRLDNVSYNTKEKVLLKNVNLILPDKRITVLYGDSGIGKTTLVNLMSGLLKPTMGTISVLGQKVPVGSNKAAQLFRRRTVSYLFQNFALLDNESVYHNLKVGTKFLKLTKREEQVAMIDALDKVGLQEKQLKQKVYTLSGGEKQRVALARVLLKPSRLLFADEPTGSVDESNRDSILAILKEIAKEKAIVMVSHDPFVIEWADNKIAVADLSR